MCSISWRQKSSIANPDPDVPNELLDCRNAEPSAFLAYYRDLPDGPRKKQPQKRGRCIGVCTTAWQNFYTITNPDPVRPVRQKKPLKRGAKFLL